MAFNPDHYKKSVDDYEMNWLTLDEVLYHLCRTHPKHDTFDGVAAKVGIIGRAYATQIERHVSSGGAQGESIMKVIGHLCANAATVDQYVSDLKVLCEPLTEQTLLKIARIHGRFVNLLCDITRNEMHVTSFASKYLHFHCPIVPIYDTGADRGITTIMRWNESMSRFPAGTDADADKTYASYLARLWPLYQQIAKAKLRLSVRYLDWYVSYGLNGGLSGGFSTP